MSIKNLLSSMLFPDGIKCIVCGDELWETPNNGICGKCLQVANTSFCVRCGRASMACGRYCLECQTTPPPVHLARAPFVYEDSAKKMVQGLKFGNRRFLVPYMARDMADTYFAEVNKNLAEVNKNIGESVDENADVSNGFSADFVAFVPMHRRKQKRRGYNQAQLLAAEVARLLGLPCLDVLERVKEIKNTATMRRFQRKEMVRDSVAVIAGVGFAGKRILLVDDVFTTGTTAYECAEKLLNSGAGRVNVLTFATSRVHIKSLKTD